MWRSEEIVKKKKSRIAPLNAIIISHLTEMCAGEVRHFRIQYIWEEHVTDIVLHSHTQTMVSMRTAVCIAVMSLNYTDMWCL